MLQTLKWQIEEIYSVEGETKDAEKLYNQETPPKSAGNFFGVIIEQYRCNMDHIVAFNMFMEYWEPFWPTKDLSKFNAEEPRIVS